MVRETIQAVAEDLKSQPLALALVIINLLFLAGGVYTMREISTASARRDQIITDLVRKCIGHTEDKGDQ